MRSVTPSICDSPGCRLSACNVWMRSANRSNSYNAGIVNSDGNCNNNNAYNGNRVAPDCADGTGMTARAQRGRPV